MSKLLVTSGHKTIRALAKIGYFIRNQEGSHVHLRHPTRNPLTIPNHKEIAKGTLRAIIREADLTVEEFNALLKD
jgi:predicted RNA binding protein YcfA (HicA-like mRNA interferase family)